MTIDLRLEVKGKLPLRTTGTWKQYKLPEVKVCSFKMYFFALMAEASTNDT